MALLELITLDNDVAGILRRKADSVSLEEIDSLQETIDNMLETMNYTGAVGLAAPQIGISKQLFVLGNGTVCINPGPCIGSSKITSHSEGCLSVPGKRYNIRRIRNVIVHCLDRHGQQQILKPRNKLHSIAIQHEIDHLYGLLVCDKGKSHD
jgi:peptide deformylase